MGQPFFRPGAVGVLFFSRGAGRGHAIVDTPIAKALLERRQDVDLRFASYATGLRELAKDWPGVFDLGLPERNPSTETLILAARLIGYLRPTLVIAHEEFPTLPACKIFQTPNVLITDWFRESREFNMSLLCYADEVLFLDRPGLYDEPPAVRGRVKYFGPVLRDFRCDHPNKGECRSELNLPLDSVVVSVIVPPGRRVESVAPTLDAVLPAFQSLPIEDKHLVWCSPDEAEALRIATVGVDGFVIPDEDYPFDRLMAVSDVVITKGNRNLVMEAAVLGVPSISITHQLNFIDDFRTSRIETNTTMNADETDPGTLADLIQAKLRQDRKPAPEFANWVDGRSAIAERLDQILSELASRKDAEGS